MVARNGYATEASGCLGVCKDTWTDDRLMEGVANVRHKHMRTRLMHAAYVGDAQRVRMWVALGADVQAKQHPIDGYTALHWAARKGRHAAIRALVELGADLNGNPESPNREYLPLHVAVMYDRVATLRLLVTLGADVRALTYCEDTALHMAGHSGYERSARALIELGADLEHANNVGLTGFHVIARNFSDALLQEVTGINNAVALRVVKASLVRTTEAEAEEEDDITDEDEEWASEGEEAEDDEAEDED